jgi:hypothetical protein
MMPGRYAKFESSSGLIASLDSYDYHVAGLVPETLDGVTAEETLVEKTPELAVTEEVMMSEDLKLEALEPSPDEVAGSNSEAVAQVDDIDLSVPEGVVEDLSDTPESTFEIEIESVPAAPDTASGERTFNDAVWAEDVSGIPETQSVNGGIDATLE